MKNNMYCFIICLLSISGCDKDINCETNCKVDLPKIIWRVPLGPKKYDQISQDPVIYKNKLVMGYQYDQQKEGYYIYDKISGNLIHELIDNPSFDPVSIIMENYYVSKNGRFIRRVNLDNYKVDWKELQNYTWTGVFMTPYKSKIYLPRYGRENYLPKENQFELIECEILNSIVDRTVLMDSFRLNKGAYGSALFRVFVRKNEREEMEIFYNAVMGFHDVNKKAIFKAEGYNLDQKKLLWSTGEFELDSISSGYVGQNIPIVIDNIKIIFSYGGSQLICYDINNGKKIWTSFFSKDKIGPLNYFNDKISFIDANEGWLHLVDPRTGQTLSRKKLDHGGPKNWAYHNNTLYFTTASSKLYAIDANTHEIKWEIKSPNNCSYCSFGSQSPVVDAETNRLYITDGLEVICYQLD